MNASYKKIKSVFSNSTEKQVATQEEFNIKTEPKFYTKNSTSDDDDEYDNESVDDAVDTFYTPDKYKRNTKFKPQNSTYQNQKYYKQNHPSKT